MPRVGLYDDPAFREHDSGPGHPEIPERLEALRKTLRSRPDLLERAQLTVEDRQALARLREEED